MSTPTGRFIGPCCCRKAEMWLSQSFFEGANCSEKITFYCPAS